MGYELIAMDMDNTVLRRDKVLSERTLHALRAAFGKGCRGVFTTGRSLDECRKYLNMMPEMEYIICNTGASIIDVQTGEYVRSAPIAPSVAQAAAEILQDFDHMATVHSGDHLYVARDDRERLEYYSCHIYATLFDETAQWVEDIRKSMLDLTQPLYKIDLFFHDAGECTAAFERLSALDVSLFSGCKNNIEIVSAGSSKGGSLTTLCGRLGIPMERVIACGDAGNDLSMVQAAGLGIAVENAVPELKAAADAVTSDCDRDGIAEVIEKYILV